VDVGVAHPLASNNAFGNQEAKVFLRNAEVAYTPTDNMRIHFQVRQSPYGRYASPYGYRQRRAFAPTAPLLPN
jgi:hypothetical protein